ncbi:MAG: hypothetical protein M1827_006099 [Pycnora praestabilis]|nr:MAG: hypothetical protein M1827_006099 [Pycnora praestabilis]
MPISICDASEEDIPMVAQVYWDAFSSNTIYQALFPQGGTPALVADTTRKYTESLRDSTTHILKAVDTETDQIAAFAVWYVYEEGRPGSDSNQGEVQEVEKENAPDNSGEGVREWRIKRARVAKKTMGEKAHCLLDMLATLPLHQGRGAGAQLVKWGIDVADAAQLPCYLESSAAGSRLYKRFGFEIVDVVSIELGKYRKGFGDYKHDVMVRRAQKAL